jgi:hypothetical protein
VSENDLCVIAEHGYEGAASTAHDQQAQAVSLFVTDMLAASIDQGNGVTTLKRRFSNGVTTVGNAVSVAREIVSEQFRRRSRARRQVREHPTAVPQPRACCPQERPAFILTD